MKRQRLTRLQLFLLLGAIGLVLWRISTRSSEIDGVVVLADMSENHVYRSGLRVDRDTEIVISMTASFETDEERAPIASYGWILNSEDRSVIWRPSRESLVRDGVLGIVTDTIHIASGVYDVFYTTVGPTRESRSNAPFLGLKPFWTNDTSKWSISISSGPGQDLDNLPIREIESGSVLPEGDGLLWATGPVGNRTANTHLFRVSEVAELSIYSIGEICSRDCDFGYIEDVRDNERVWELTWDNTVPAGGAESNRLFRGTISLEPGIYRAGYQSDNSHASNRWRANPPWDPDGWGMTITNVPRSNVMSYDPWKQTQPIVDLTRVGDDAIKKAQFRVNARSTYLISAMGEMQSRGSVYDYGWLELNETQEIVWKMTYRNSSHAGGDRKNRVETVFLDLEPGTYTVYYQSDDSHSFGRFNSSEPDHPERWGLALFPVSDDGNSNGTFTLLDDAWTTEMRIESADVRELYKGGSREEMVNFNRVSNDAHLSAAFDLDDPTSLYIVAIGELSTSGRYDYGWIEHANSGERIWEMTAKNTVHAGGREQNRRFEGLVQVPAGQYVARYVTDFSHAYGDFDDDGPTYQAEWGMRIFRYERPVPFQGSAIVVPDDLN